MADIRRKTKAFLQQEIPLEDLLHDDDLPAIIRDLHARQLDLERKLAGRTAELHTEIDRRQQTEEELRKYRGQFEAEVAVRTAELTMVNQQLQHQIAERRLVEEIVRENEERFRTVANFTYDWEYWIGPEGSYVYVSPSCERITGYSPREFHANPNLLEQIVHPEDLPRLKAHLKTELNGQTVHTLEFRIITRRGEQRWVGHGCQPIYSDDGRWLGQRASNRDITEQKEAEAALRHSEARYRSLFENSPIALWEVDFSAVKIYLDQLRAQGVTTLTEYMLQHPEAVAHCAELIKVVDINQTAVELYGAADKQDLMHNISRVFTSETTAPFRATIAALAEGRPRFDTEMKTQTLSGKDLWVNLSWSVAPGFEQTYAKVFISLLDTTQRRQAEEGLHRYAQRLKAVHDIDRDVLAARLPEAVAQVALAHLKRLIPYDWASVVEFDDDASQARLLASSDGSMMLPGKTLFQLKTDIVSHGRVTLIDDIQNLPEHSPYQQVLARRGVRSFVSIQLVIQNELIGVLNLASGQPWAFTLDSLEITEDVSVSLAIAIRQARLFEQTRQDAATKAILLQEVNHRVKNNLTAIIGLLYAERRRAAAKHDPMYQAVLMDLINRIRGLATVHSLLSASEWAPVSLRELVSRVVHSGLQVVPSDKTVTVNIDASDLRVSPKQANSLALIISELTTNTIKHTLDWRAGTVISVDLCLQADKICLRFADDGPGYAPSMLPPSAETVGLSLIQAIVDKDLAGQVHFYNDDGAIAEIQFQSMVEEP